MFITAYIYIYAEHRYGYFTETSGYITSLEKAVCLKNWRVLRSLNLKHPGDLCRPMRRCARQTCPKTIMCSVNSGLVWIQLT
jgi:hypothetical protein